MDVRHQVSAEISVHLWQLDESQHRWHEDLVSGHLVGYLELALGTMDDQRLDIQRVCKGVSILGLHCQRIAN